MRVDPVVPFAVDLSSLAKRSVATLYSHLVTRPMGAALRVGIDSQIRDLGTTCLSVLDFTQVVVLDYSCADEAIAKLLRVYSSADRPSEAYFVARGLAERHLEPLEEVLLRHDLVLAAEVEGDGFTLLGRVGPMERLAWTALQDGPCASPAALAESLPGPESAAAAALDVLMRRRTVMRRGETGEYCALPLLLD